MVTDLDAFRTAHVLINDIGEKEAKSFATARAVELHLADDAEGRATWQRVLSAMHELTRKKGDREAIQ